MDVVEEHGHRAGVARGGDPASRYRGGPVRTLARRAVPGRPPTCQPSPALVPGRMAASREAARAEPERAVHSPGGQTPPRRG